MSKKDFFVLLIRIFALFSMLNALFTVLPANLSFALTGIDAFSIFWIILAASALISLYALLIFKSEKVVSFLKLDKGFEDDKINLGQLSTIEIVKIATFVLGALLIINSIPSLFSHLLFAVKGDVAGPEFVYYESSGLIFSSVKIILGLILIRNYNLVAGLFNIRQNK